jgi:phosphotransacetylase
MDRGVTMRDSLPSFDELYRRCDESRSAAAVVAVGANDATVLQALRTACTRGWCEPILAGRAKEIQHVAESCGVGLHGMRLLDAEAPAPAAVAEVKAGRAQLLMKGRIATPALLRPMLGEGGLRTGSVICQVVMMEIVRDRRRFLLADTGICILPTLDQKMDILFSAVETAHRLGVAAPRVAIMAASESVNEVMPETVDAAELTKRRIAGCVVQGPLSFDLAYAADAADKKRVEGPVTGAADVMLFPSLAAANLTVKAIMYTADCRFGGVLCGAACPVVFMSRADSTATRLNSLALALSLTPE